MDESLAALYYGAGTSAEGEGAGVTDSVGTDGLGVGGVGSGTVGTDGLGVGGVGCWLASASAFRLLASSINSFNFPRQYRCSGKPVSD